MAHSIFRIQAIFEQNKTKQINKEKPQNKSGVQYQPHTWKE